MLDAFAHADFTAFSFCLTAVSSILLRRLRVAAASPPSSGARIDEIETPMSIDSSGLKISLLRAAEDG